MSASHKRSVKDHYDELGGTVYDAQYGDEQLLKYSLALRLVPLPEEGLLLDDGCGTGMFLRDLGERGVGLDLSSSLLSTAKKLTRESSLIQGDAEALPLRKSIFVGVYSFTLIQNTPNPVTAMAEMARVVRVGGWVVVTAIRKAFTRESFECLIESQEWAELHLSEEDSHDIVAYAMIRN
jgi:ubiquinone/menaquinone biosynthesis C-methylase UbiE